MNGDPRNIPHDRLNRMEDEVASVLADRWSKLRTPTAKGFAPFMPKNQYVEADAAALLGIDLSTLRRNRRAERVPYTPYGNGSIRYTGWQLVHYYLFGASAVLLWGAGAVPPAPKNDNGGGSGAPASP